MLLKPGDYYTQRNNEFYPGSACMPTSRVMFYIAAGIKYSNISNLPDDDYFMSILRTDEAEEFKNNKYPSLSKYPGNQIHGMYHSYLDPIVVGNRTSDFKTNLEWNDFVSEIKNGNPVMTSGRFHEIDGHAFVVIGYENEELIIADPWGNFKLRYLGPWGRKGYGIRMNRQEFEEHVKPGELKWGHIRSDR